MDSLQKTYPWTHAPLIANGPMRLIALAALAVEVSAAGGLGFIGAGSDASTLASILSEARTLAARSPSLAAHTTDSQLPIGIGFLLWAGEALLTAALPLIEQYRPAAVWLYAHRELSEAERWAAAVRQVTDGATQIWIQIGTVAEAVEATRVVRPDVIVVQGQDAGGHGLLHGAGLLPLFPEVEEAVAAVCVAENLGRTPVLVAAGGIIEGRGAAAALALGAAGVVMGTRYLAAPEAVLADGYRDAVLRAADGGVTTARGTLYDRLRGTTEWPERYGGRGVLNRSWFEDAEGLPFEENKRRYDAAADKGDEGWGEQARLTTYAGSGVGLTRKVQPAKEITQEVREEARQVLARTAGRFS